MDESLFTHGKNNTQILVLGIINDASKEFRLEATKTRDNSILKKFVASGNKIVTDDFSSYNILTDEAYLHDIHNHGGGNLEFGTNSTSYVESLWNSLKGKIKNTNHSIPSHNFISFLRESQRKFNNRNKNWEGKIREFFDCYRFIEDVKDSPLNKNEFLSDDDINDSSSSDGD